ncbi:PepSY domain-containing protein [Pseudomonas sp. ML96]|uniref:PepSY domain-containing protein n=1 Tax=Pseudomonas sp. ML96 TaxID=1523503 RepID=UPI0005BD185D|nr:PepSY domain-containing protein [Pseudomonas sp. ML96]
MRFLLIPALLIASTAALASPQCTTADRSTWKDPEQFQAQLKEQGYQISKFKITSGNCYEIYGFDKDKRKVEIYHDPVTGQPVKSKVES